MIRILHFSDPHNARGIALPRRLDKRIVGYANYALRRRHHHRDVEAKLAELAELAVRERVDLAICTGDLSALGTEAELLVAREAIAAFETLPLGLFLLRGNHDVYLREDGVFDRIFDGLLHSDLPEVTIDGRWPRVRLYGDELAVIGIESTRPNPQPWRSSGYVRPAEIDAVRAALRHPRIAGRTVLLATHYALLRENGKADTPRHGIVNTEEILETLGDISVAALLHGHIHHCFYLRPSSLRFPILGAGSLTYEGREGFWLLELDERRMRAYRGSRRNGEFALEREPIELPSP